MRLGWLGASRLGSCTPGWHQGLYGSALLTTLFSQSGSGLHDWGVKLLYGAQPPVMSHKFHVATSTRAAAMSAWDYRQHSPRQ